MATREYVFKDGRHALLDLKPRYTRLDDREFAAGRLSSELIGEALWTEDKAAKMLFMYLITEEQLVKSVGVLADLDYIVKNQRPAPREC